MLWLTHSALALLLAALCVSPVAAQPPCCLNLGSDALLQWQPSNGSTLSFSMSTNRSGDGYVAFGPASPQATNRLMAGSEVVAAGTTPAPWASRLTLQGYEPCSVGPPASGVCPSQAFPASGAAGGAGGAALVGTSTQHGVTSFNLTNTWNGASLLHAIPVS